MLYVLIVQSFNISVRPSDQSSTSTGSYEIGTEVEQETQEWWPSQTLKAQLWSLWDHLKLWNGAPKLDIPYVFDPLYLRYNSRLG